MTFGKRRLEAGEPVLYFENVSISMLTERSNPIMARGGWANLPHVVWEDRSEVQFVLSEGVMSSISMGILLSAVVTSPEKEGPLLISKKEGPFDLTEEHRLFLSTKPFIDQNHKTFIFDYDRSVAQKKVYGKIIHGIPDPFDNTKERNCIEVYEDKELTQLADTTKQYLVDYYYEYGDEALLYTVQKERFNGLFSLEGKFYSKDENEGLNYTNVIYMPKVRVVSDINLRLGERADPTVSVFNIIGMPENAGGSKKNLIFEITRLNTDEDGTI